jgi:hypothetical protein
VELESVPQRRKCDMAGRQGRGEQQSARHAKACRRSRTVVADWHRVQSGDIMENSRFGVWSMGSIVSPMRRNHTFTNTYVAECPCSTCLILDVLLVGVLLCHCFMSLISLVSVYGLVEGQCEAGACATPCTPPHGPFNRAHDVDVQGIR